MEDILIIRTAAKGDVIRCEPFLNSLATSGMRVHIGTLYPIIFRDHPNITAHHIANIPKLQWSKIINLDGQTERYTRQGLRFSTIFDTLGIKVGTDVPKLYHPHLKSGNPSKILICPEAGNRVWSGSDLDLSPFSGRIWPYPRYIEIINHFKKSKNIALSVLPDNKQFFDFSAVEDADNWWKDWDTLIRNMLSCEFVICNDSFVYHLAVALKVKVFAIVPRISTKVSKYTSKNSAYLISSKSTKIDITDGVFSNTSSILSIQVKDVISTIEENINEN